jgi:ribosomal protein S18 acetylase RimI-like enzyme
VASLGSLVEAVWGWDEADQRRRFHEAFTPARTQRTRLIVVDGVEVGVLIVEDQGGEVLLELIEVLPSYQRRGLGSAVVRDLLDRASRRGSPVALRVLKVNPAQKLYRRLGFDVVGETDTHLLMRREAASNPPCGGA